MQNQNIVRLLLRISIASVFLYASIAATLQPQNWIYFIPQFVQMIMPVKTFLLIFSGYELLLALWLLSGFKAFYAAIIASITIVGIIGSNFTELDVLFRDFAIFFASLALAVGSFSKKGKQ